MSCNENIQNKTAIAPNKEKLTALLSARKDINDWKLTITRSTSYQVYCVHGKTETLRKSDCCDVTVTVYVMHDGCMGSSAFKVFALDTDEKILQKADAAAAAAKLIFDKPYTLQKDVVVDCAVPDGFNGADIETLAQNVCEAAKKACTVKNCDFNALEIFVTDAENEVINSQNVSAKQSSRNIFIEAIPTYTDNDVSVELYKTFYLSDSNFDALSHDMTQSLSEVVYRAKAVVPKEKISCPVVFGTEEISQIIQSLVGDSDYSAAYSSVNVHAVGDGWSKQACPLTVTLKGEIEGCADSAAFDADGVVYKEVKVLKEGIVTAMHGSKRFADYMNAPATGVNPCMEVQPGQAEESDMLGGKCLFVLSMSGLQIEKYNDYIGGEVRLALMYDDGKITPVTGISISGSLSEVLGSMTLSKQTKTLKNYRGPMMAKTDKLTIF